MADNIKTTLESKGIDLQSIRGQGYDGASNMSSDAVGVQKRMKEFSPQAAYVHCNSHVLNLVIAKTCSLVEVRGVIDKLKSVCLFFFGSPKREGLLEAIVSKNLAGDGKERKRKALIDLCKTRWAARHDAYRHFYQAYFHIIETFEQIKFGPDPDDDSVASKTFADWDPKSKSEASSLLIGITSFSFLVTFNTVYKFLAHLEGVTKKLQSSTLDILQAHKMV